MWPIVTDVWWSLCVSVSVSVFVSWTQSSHNRWGGSVAEWLACWTQAQRNSLRQTVRIHRASVHQAARLAAALLRVARVTAGLAESNGSVPLGL